MCMCKINWHHVCDCVSLHSIHPCLYVNKWIYKRVQQMFRHPDELLKLSDLMRRSLVRLRDVLCLLLFLNIGRLLGESPWEITSPFFLCFFTLLLSLPVPPSSALLISLRYGSQWHLLLLLCAEPIMSLLPLVLAILPRPLLLHPHAVQWLAVCDACSASCLWTWWFAPLQGDESRIVIGAKLAVCARGNFMWWPQIST